MADQVTTERAFTPGDIRVLADVARAVANGTIATDELQAILNQRKITQEKMPVWVRVYWVPCLKELVVAVFEKRSSIKAGYFVEAELLTTIEDITVTRECVMKVYGETVSRLNEMKERLRTSNLPNIDIAYYIGTDDGRAEKVC